MKTGRTDHLVDVATSPLESLGRLYLVPIASTLPTGSAIWRLVYVGFEVIYLFLQPPSVSYFFELKKLSCRGLRSSQNYAQAVIHLDDPFPSALSLCASLVSG